MPTPGEKREALPGRLLILRFRQDTTAAGHNCVPGEHMRAIAPHGYRFFERHAPGIVARQFRSGRGFVYIGCDYGIGRDPDAREKLATARTGGGKDQSRLLAARSCVAGLMRSGDCQALSIGRGHRDRA